MIRQKAITPSYFRERPELCALCAMVVGNEQWLGQSADDSSPVRNTLAHALQQSQTKGGVVLLVICIQVLRILSTRKPAAGDAQYTDTCQMTSRLIQKENKQCIVIQTRSVLAMISLSSLAILHLYQYWTVIGTCRVS
jgi:hypothetical protein